MLPPGLTCAAEIGKVLKALRTLGLEVIIQPRGYATLVHRTGRTRRETL